MYVPTTGKNMPLFDELLELRQVRSITATVLIDQRTNSVTDRRLDPTDLAIPEARNTSSGGGTTYSSYRLIGRLEL